MLRLGVLALIVAIASVILGWIVAAVAAVLGVLAFRSGSRRLAIAAFVFVVIAVALRVILLAGFGAKPYVVPTGSMAPTFDRGDRILTFRESDPTVGEIVVFHPPADFYAPSCPAPPGAACAAPGTSEAKDDLLKRVVAVEGDTFRMERGIVYVNDEPLDFPICEPAAVRERRCNFPEEITIPEGTVYVIGDNVALSEDSRYWGPIPVDWVHHRAVLTYWPLDQFGQPD